MMPERAHMLIKRVSVSYSVAGNYVVGFIFKDRENKTIFEIGDLNGSFVDVNLDDDEQIVGVKARLLPNFRSVYTDYQFIIAARQ
jgi:hypothetical protein